MAISEDSSTPAAVQDVNGSGQPVIATASFSPPAGSLLVAVVSLAFAGTASLSVTDSGSHTWTTAVSENPGSPVAAAIFTCQLTTAPGSITVTAHGGASVTAGSIQLALRVIDGAATSQAGAGTLTGAATSAAVTGAIVTTKAGSSAYIAGAVNDLETVTPNASTTTITNDQDSVGGDSLIAGRATNATVTPGSTTLGWTVGTSAPYALAMLEILPAAAAAAAAPPAAALLPPAPFTPMAWQRQSWPSQARPEVPSADSGTGTDTATIGISDTDAGTGTDTAGITVAGADTGSGTDQGGIPGTAFPLIPPGLASPMAWRFQSWPSQAPSLVSGSDTGTGADAGSVTPSNIPPPPPAAILIPPSPFTPMGFQWQAGPTRAPLSAADADTGTGTDTATIGVAGSDTGTGAESALAGPPVRAYPLTPPGRQSPMAPGWQAWPSGAPVAVPSQDAGTGADAATITVADTDTGTGTDSGAVTATVSGSDTGTGTDTATAGALPGTGIVLAPPGYQSPAAFLRPSVPPTGAQARTVITGTDTGTGADSGSLPPTPVTGAGIVQWLNAVRESMTGLDVTLHMSQALGAILQFGNTGSERIYVLAASPGVTLTVGVSSLVLDQPARPFGSVTLTAGQLYAFGPFHTVLQVPGTSTVQVTLSTTYGVQVVVIQGPHSH